MLCLPPSLHPLAIAYLARELQLGQACRRDDLELGGGRAARATKLHPVSDCRPERARLAENIELTRNSAPSRGGGLGFCLRGAHLSSSRWRDATLPLLSLLGRQKSAPPEQSRRWRRLCTMLVNLWPPISGLARPARRGGCFAGAARAASLRQITLSVWQINWLGSSALERRASSPEPRVLAWQLFIITTVKASWTRAHCPASRLTGRRGPARSAGPSIISAP